MLAAPLVDTNRQKNKAGQAADKCNMVTLMTTVQQIMMGLQTVDTVNMRAVYGLFM
jgi:hypothetical protein